MKRANLLVAAGAFLLIAGLVVVWVLGREGDDAPSEPMVSVLVARADLEPGQGGDDLVAAGKVGVTKVAASKVTPGTLSDTTDLAGKILSTQVPDGAQVTAAATQSETLRSPAIEIPKGKEAVAVTVGSTEGLAGYAGPGDHVNLYVTVLPDDQGASRAPYTKLLLQDVSVLDVSKEVTPLRSTSRASATQSASGSAGVERTAEGTLTLFVALDSQQTEQLVFAGTNNQLWFSVVSKDHKAEATTGVDYGTNYLDPTP